MRLYELLGVFATLSFAIPVVIILFWGLFINKSLLALAIYCCISGVFNAMNSHLWAVKKETLVNTGILTSLLDAPLMLGLLALYCHNRSKKLLVIIVAVLYILYEVVIVLQLGLQPMTTVYASGVGLMVVFALGVYFFVGQLKQTVRFNKGFGRTFVAAAIFFAYGLYNIVYFLNCIYEAPEIGDIILLYNITGIIFCALVTTGLVHFYQQHRQIKQLLRVRRELREFFEA